MDFFHSGRRLQPLSLCVPSGSLVNPFLPLEDYCLSLYPLSPLSLLHVLPHAAALPVRPVPLGAGPDLFNGLRCALLLNRVNVDMMQFTVSPVSGAQLSGRKSIRLQNSSSRKTVPVNPTPIPPPGPWSPHSVCLQACDSSRASHKWSSTVPVLSCLACFSRCDVLEVYLV